MTVPMMRDYISRIYAQTAPALAFSAEDADAWGRWRPRLIEAVSDLLGLPAQERCPPAVVVTDRVDAGSYWRETLSFASEPGVRVPAYRLRPKQPPPARQGAALLCLHGHGRGMDDVAGLAATARERQARIRALHYDYGHELASRGYVVLIPQARAMGMRSHGEMDCTWAMTTALLVGKVLVGLRVWDAVRAIDVLAADDDVDPARIGCVGLSWGGTHTMYTAALDSRVKLAVIGGAFGTFGDALIESAECPCQYVPNLLRVADLPDIVAAIAPRAVLIQQGRDDQHATLEVVHEAFARVQAAYRVAGAADAVTLDLFAGGHRFNAEAAVPWIAERL